MARPAPRSFHPTAAPAAAPSAVGADGGAARPRPDRRLSASTSALARRVRPSRTAAAFALVLAAFGPPAGSLAQRASFQQEAIYSAGMGNAAGAQVEFECRANRPTGPEVAIGLVLPHGSRLRQDKGIPAKVTAGDLALDAAFAPLGVSSGQTVYRWAAIESTALAVVRRVSRALGTEGELEVQDAETSAVETFAYTAEKL